jgi:hypothetical protein
MMIRLALENQPFIKGWFKVSLDMTVKFESYQELEEL